MTLRILLLACYEMGQQPLSLAWPLAFLKDAGYTARALDLSIESLTEDTVQYADFIGISVPMHTALRLGVQAARRARALNPRAHICFYGLYASLNADLLLGNGCADSVISGEAEAPMLELIRAIAAGRAVETLAGVSTRAARAQPHLARLAFPIPERTQLPTLDHYAHYTPNGTGGMRLAGYVEASRGCLHTCQHCPIVPVYHGRFFVVPAEVVLADVEQQVAMGAQHITFGDPDFLNGPTHSLKITRVLHERWPHVTFDFTTKVEHILQHRALFTEFAALGCTFVVSAIESMSDRVLAHLHKGHTAADIDTALSILDSAGIALQPTLVAFTPWTALEDYVAQIEFIRERGLLRHIPPVQLSIRLLLPPGSPLVQSPDAVDWLGELDAENFTYRWTHPDPRMDALYARAATRVADAEACGEAAEITFVSIRALAYRAANRSMPMGNPMPVRPAPPRLTENWFC